MNTNKQNLIKWLWLVAVAVFCAGLLAQTSQQTVEAINYGIPQVGRLQTNKVLDETQSLADRVSPPRTNEAGTYPVSCYTAIESHGKVGRNEWSAASYQFPIGTKIYIEGIGERIVETRTSKTYRDRVDIWFGDNYEECLKFGLQQLKIWTL